MRALSKLINDNEPDLVLFVGEALVGNDGVNQLHMFNQVTQSEESYSYTASEVSSMPSRTRSRRMPCRTKSWGPP